MHDRRPRAAPRWIAALAVALVGCTRAPPPSQLAIASVRQAATSLLFVARDAGCLARERLSLEERSFELGRDALEELRRGAVDVAIAYETPLLRAALEDARLRILTKLHTSTANTRLVTRARTGIQGFADLRGRSVGLARGTNADFFAVLAFALGGVPRSETTSVDLSPEAAVAAIVRGEVDTVVLSDPYAGMAEAALGTEARTLVTDLYVEASFLITRADVLAAKEPALRALVAGLSCAERYAREHPAEARAFVRARLPEQDAEAVSRQLDRVRWGVGLDNVLVELLRQERDWLVATAPGHVSLHLDGLVEPRLLEAVDPESVTLLSGTGAPRW